MGISITDYPMVQERLRELDCPPLTEVAILPENFDIATSCLDLRQRSEAGTVRSLFRKYNVPTNHIPALSGAPHIQNNSFEWIAPVLFIGAGVVSENSSVASLALGVLGNYLTDFFRGIPGNKKVKMEIVVERQADRMCRRISYEGDLNGLMALPEIIKKVSHE